MELRDSCICASSLYTECDHSSTRRLINTDYDTLSLQSDSPYKGGTFKFSLVLPENYPFKAPAVRSNLCALDYTIRLYLLLTSGYVPRSPSTRRSTTPGSTRRDTSACLFCVMRSVVLYFCKPKWMLDEYFEC
jgi:hypothetical protein